MSLVRIIAVFVVAVGALTAAHFVATVIYHDGSPEYPIWEAWNWVMAVAFIPMIIATLHDKMTMQRGLDGEDGPVTRRYLEANVLFYATVGLAISFFWNWLWGFNPGSEGEWAQEGHVQVWAVFQPIYAPVVIAIGLRLWRKG